MSRLRIGVGVCVLVVFVVFVAWGAGVKFMTYNVHHCAGVDEVYDVWRIAELIKESGAEVVGLQEVDDGYSGRSYWDDQPELIASWVGGVSWFYGPNIYDTYGNMLLVDGEIMWAENVGLPNPAGKEPRGVIVAEVEAAGLRMNVLVTHLSAFEPENRPPQVEMIKGIAYGLGGNTVVMGDFNCLPSGEMGMILEEGKFVSTRAILEMGESIDDILVSRGLVGSVVSGGIIESVASDHDAYWVVIDMESGARGRAWALYE